MGNLDDLRAAVCGRLGSIPVLAGVPVLPEDREDLLAEIRKALMIAGGLAITVATGNARGVAPNLPMPQADVEIYVTSSEVPVINRGKKGRKIPAITTAVISIVALHHFPWETGKTLVFDSLQYDKDSKSKIVLYTAVFKTRVSFEAQLGV